MAVIHQPLNLNRQSSDQGNNKIGNRSVGRKAFCRELDYVIPAGQRDKKPRGKTGLENTLIEYWGRHQNPLWQWAPLWWRFVL